MKKIRYAIAAGVILAVIGSVAAYSLRHSQSSDGGPYFYATILKALYGSTESGIYRFSFSDFSESGTGGFDDAFIRDHKFIDIGLGRKFVPRRVCQYDGATLLTGGKNGAQPGDPARIFQITESGEKRLLMESPEARFRDCASGKMLGKRVFGTITHGNGYLYLRVMDTGEEHVYHVPYVGLQKNKATLLHFMQFADLDGDGNDELYFSATTPYF